MQAWVAKIMSFAISESSLKIEDFELIDNPVHKLADEALVKAGALQNAIFNSANFSSIAKDAKGVIA